MDGSDADPNDLLISVRAMPARRLIRPRSPDLAMAIRAHRPSTSRFFRMASAEQQRCAHLRPDCIEADARTNGLLNGEPELKTGVHCFCSAYAVQLRGFSE